MESPPVVRKSSVAAGRGEEDKKSQRRSRRPDDLVSMTPTDGIRSLEIDRLKFGSPNLEQNEPLALLVVRVVRVPHPVRDLD